MHIALKGCPVPNSTEDRNAECPTPHGRPAEHGWQDIVDAIPDMICFLDNDGRIIRCNRSFRERLALTSDRIVGSRCTDVLQAAGAIPSRTLSSEGRGMETPAIAHADIEIGKYRFSVSSTLLRGPGGAAVGTVRMFHDVTDLKVVNEHLIQDRKMEAVGRLTGEIAHEINNPLLYIGNYLYLLSEELQGDFEKMEYIERIQGGVDKLTAFTQVLTDISRPINGTYLPVDLEYVLDSSLEFMAEGLQKKQIEIVRRFGCRGEVRVLGSGEKLRQVFVDLTQNAADAMQQGGALTVATVCGEHDITITFEDTGVGIPEEAIHRIFEPFFTTKKGTSKKGAGLGLAVCYNIIRRHGGEIAASSRAGSGTKITVTLPVSPQRS